MNKAEAARRAYQWAVDAMGDKHTPVMILRCADLVAKCRDKYGPGPLELEKAYEPLVGVVRDLIAERRETYAKAIRILCRHLQIESADEPVAT